MAKKEYIGENRLNQLLTLLKSKIDAKVDKVTGKGLSTNDYTTAEKNKLASIPSIGNGTLKIQKNGTDVATFTANQAGNVTANITVPTSKSDIGLGNVDNTSDANKPISTATQTALDGKLDEIGGAELGSVSGGGQYNYCLVATIKVISNYANYPIVFEISGRHRYFSIVQILFNGGNTSDPALNSFISDNNVEFYLYKSATSTWQLYGVYNESWGNLALHRITGAGNNLVATVTVNLQNVSSIPSGATKATLFNADTWRPVQNNLTSTSTTDSLSANQGRLLANGSARDSTKVAKSGDTMTGTLTFNKVNNAIAYTGTKSTVAMIKFKDNTADASGNGVVIGGGGLVVVGGGESADTIAATHSTGGDEVLELAADGDVNIWTNVQNGTSSAKKFGFNTAGEFKVPSGGKVVSPTYTSPANTALRIVPPELQQLQLLTDGASIDISADNNLSLYGAEGVSIDSDDDIEIIATDDVSIAGEGAVELKSTAGKLTLYGNDEVEINGGTKFKAKYVSRGDTVGDGITVPRDGLAIWQENNESAGIILTGDGIAIFAPPDNYALGFINEDGNRLDWYIDTDGYMIDNYDDLPVFLPKAEICSNSEPTGAAKKAYAIGDYMLQYYDHECKLYRVTQPIAANAGITSNNTTHTTITDELKRKTDKWTKIWEGSGGATLSPAIDLSQYSEIGVGLYDGDWVNFQAMPIEVLRIGGEGDIYIDFTLDGDTLYVNLQFDSNGKMNVIYPPWGTNPSSSKKCYVYVR